jgi:hypothetical protein
MIPAPFGLGKAIPQGSLTLLKKQWFFKTCLFVEI